MQIEIDIEQIKLFPESQAEEYQLKAIHHALKTSGIKHYVDKLPQEDLNFYLIIDIKGQ